MTAAPVGFHCPECVAEGTKSLRQPATPLGGEVREHGNLITKVLIALNAAIWILVRFGDTDQVTERFMLFQLAIMPSAGQLGGVLDGEWYRMLTAAFVHVEIWHIGLNMFALWILGSALEPVLGRWRFLTLYVLSALGGSAVSLLALEGGEASLGASGAVFGLFGALFVVARRFDRDVSALVVILGINLVIGFTIPNIDWRAHLGGLVVGVVLAYAFAHAPRTRRTAFGVAASLLVFGAITLTVGVFVA
jgi:membrane associated rhomboid family serine protease